MARRRSPPLSQPSQGGYSVLTEGLFGSSETIDQAIRRFGYRRRERVPEAKSRSDNADDDQAAGQSIERLTKRNRLWQPDAMAGMHEGSSRKGRIVGFKEDPDLACVRRAPARLANSVDHDTNRPVLPQPQKAAAVSLMHDGRQAAPREGLGDIRADTVVLPLGMADPDEDPALDSNQLRRARHPA